MKNSADLGGSGNWFPPNPFSVMVPVSGHFLVLVPASRVAMETCSLYIAAGTPLTVKAPVPWVICL